MPKIIIYITGKPGLHGFKRREFLWSEPHKLYLWGGRELELREFNDAWPKAYSRNHDMNPQVKVILEAGKTEGPPAKAPTKDGAQVVKGAVTSVSKPRPQPKQPAVTRALEIA